MGRVVRVRGAGAVRVAGDELLPLLAFVVHRVAQRACSQSQTSHFTGALTDARRPNSQNTMIMTKRPLLSTQAWLAPVARACLLVCCLLVSYRPLALPTLFP